jgi:hypothetical protein
VSLLNYILVKIDLSTNFQVEFLHVIAKGRFDAWLSTGDIQLYKSYRQARGLANKIASSLLLPRFKRNQVRSFLTDLIFLHYEKTKKAT